MGQDFSKEVSLCQSEGTQDIVMAFSPPVEGCLFKKAYKMGVTATRRGLSLATSVMSVFHRRSVDVDSF